MASLNTNASLTSCRFNLFNVHLAPFIVPPNPTCSFLAFVKRAPSSSMVEERLDTRDSSCSIMDLVWRSEAVTDWAAWVAESRWAAAGRRWFGWVDGMVNGDW
eukprot:scaffold134956_cov38-Cyclotella_meneghiniana.AAC.1